MVYPKTKLGWVSAEDQWSKPTRLLPDPNKLKLVQG